jgi:hypothetical protein
MGRHSEALALDDFQTNLIFARPGRDPGPSCFWSACLVPAVAKLRSTQPLGRLSRTWLVGVSRSWIGEEAGDSWRCCADRGTCPSGT